MDYRKEIARWQTKLAALEAEEKALRQRGQETEAAEAQHQAMLVREHVRRLGELS